MTDWAKLKVVDLKAELKRRDLAQSGLKAELVARLEAADEELQETDGAAAGGDPEDDAPDGDAEAQTAAVAEPIAEPVAMEPEAPATSIVAAENKNNESPDVAPEPISSFVGNGVGDSTPVAAANVAVEAEQQQAGHATAQPDELAVPTAVEQPDAKPEVASALPDTIDTREAQPDQPQHVEPAEQPAVDEMAIDSAPDSQKRKRRSASPLPSDEAMARKRARADDPATGDIAPAVRLVDEEDFQPTQADDVMADAENGTVDDVAMGDDNPLPTDDLPDVAPSVHPATSALYISNLMRPLRPADIRSHLLELASTRQAHAGEDVIVDFHLDQIRTHAFVVFTSTDAAVRVRALLHDRVWPNESNRKALWVDFIPPEKVVDWIETEESGGRSNRGQRWEVRYQDGADGVEVRLETGTVSASKAGPPPSARPPTGPAYVPPHNPDGVNAIPVGPRGFVAPTGPRAIRPGTGPGPRPPPQLGGVLEHTHSQPSISYQTVSDDLARRRLENMRSYYTRDTDRPLGREINRFSFENGDSFVDRGKEIFEGIRPPHRERGGGGRGGRGGYGGGFGGRPPRRGGGPPPFRPRDDRYRDDRYSGGGGRNRDSQYYDGDSYRGRGYQQYGDNRDTYRDRDYRDRRY